MRAAAAEPSLAWRTRIAGPEGVADGLAQQIRASERVRMLLSERCADGTIRLHPYAKWRGAHWVLVTLAELGYPEGDSSLDPLREQVLAWLLSDVYERRWTPKHHGLCRMHASQDANAVWYLLRLGLADERVDLLIRRLLEAQWPDGGWNCEPRESTRVSSFEETLIPLRALALYAQHSTSPEARAAAERAAEVFLGRRLYRRLSDGLPIAERFLRLAFPRHWHYDLLFGLVVMAEAGFIQDPRCDDALDVLESKRLADGGFPAETRYYRPPHASSNASLVTWGGTNRRRSNPWITADALAVLTAAGRAASR